MNRGSWKIGGREGRGGCARHSFPRMQITSVYYFANAGKEEEEASSIWKIMKRYFDCACAYISSVETVGKAGQFFGYRSKARLI